MGENVSWPDAKMNPTHLYIEREQISEGRHTKALQVRTVSLRKSESEAKTHKQTKLTLCKDNPKVYGGLCGTGEE